MVLDEHRTDAVTEAGNDMNMLIEEMQLCLLAAAMYTHVDKMRLILKLRVLRGAKRGDPPEASDIAYEVVHKARKENP